MKKDSFFVNIESGEIVTTKPMSDIIPEKYSETRLNNWFFAIKQLTIRISNFQYFSQSQ